MSDVPDEHPTAHGSVGLSSYARVSARNRIHSSHAYVESEHGAHFQEYHSDMSTAGPRKTTMATFG